MIPTRFATLHTQIYRIEHANVEDLGKELASILQPYGVTPENAEERGLYLIPLTRLNAIVVFGFNEESFQPDRKMDQSPGRPARKGRRGAPSMYTRSRTPRPPTWPACWAIYTVAVVVAAGGGAGATARAVRMPTAAIETRAPDSAAAAADSADAARAAAGAAAS